MTDSVSTATSVAAGVSTGSANSDSFKDEMTAKWSPSSSLTPSRIVPVPKSGRKQKGHSDSGPNVAASYARYSTENQDEKSIDDQQRTCRERAAQDGLNIPTEFEFSDCAVSGTMLRREGLDKLLELATQREFQTLYFHSLSRLSRETVIMMPKLKELVYVHHVRVISLAEQIDTNNMGWELIASVISLINEQYLRDLSANVLRGQIGTVLSHFSAGDHRFGYNSIPSPSGEVIGGGRNAKPRMIYQIDKEQADWVRRIYDWFVVERQTVGWIVKELNRHNVPKDHRSSTTKWARASVIGILRSPKYIGVWTWGLMKNVRNPLTGQISQELRPKEESDQWNRVRPELRIIDDETFEAAQKFLDENDLRCEESRNDQGHLRGSSSGNGRKHLLAGLLQCAGCGSKLIVGGSNGIYLVCPGARDGVCNCRTQLPRQIAESLILNAISDCLRENSKWTECVHQTLCCTWNESLSTRPDEVRQLKEHLNEKVKKNRRLIKIIEESENPPADILKRIAEIGSEREDLERQLKKLESQPVAIQTPPTREWTEEQLTKLGDVIRSSTPAANIALRNLLSGSIVVEEIPVEGKKRRFWRGTLVIRSGHVAATAVPLLSPASGCVNETVETIVLDFRSLTKASGLGDKAWKLYKDGRLMAEIAFELGVGKSATYRIVNAAAKERGETIVDGRKRRSTLDHKQMDQSEHVQLLDAVKRLYDDGLQHQEIANQLNVCFATVTFALRDWHKLHGLTMLDGRARHALLNRHSTKDQCGGGCQS